MINVIVATCFVVFIGLGNFLCSIMQPRYAIQFDLGKALGGHNCVRRSVDPAEQADAKGESFAPAAESSPAVAGLLHDLFKQLLEQFRLLKPSMPVFRKCGVIWDLLIEALTGEPAPRQMHAQFLYQLAFTADAVQNISSDSANHNPPALVSSPLY
jgi:hypothetical protein